MNRFISYFGLLLLAACTAEHQAALQLQNTGKPALHAVHSERLHSLMTQLNDLVFERMLTEVELDRERRLRTREMAKTADVLLETAQDIPQALPALSLDAKERQTFLDLSERLKGQVAQLKQEAEHNYVDGIPKRLEHIVATCNACHHLFRQLPVTK